MTADTSHEHRPLNGPAYTHGHATLPGVPHEHTTAAGWQPEVTGLDRAIAASVRRQELDRWQREARAAGPRAGRCQTCGQHTSQLIAAYGWWECEDCYWTDGTPQVHAAREVARELGCDVSEILA